MDNLTYNKIDTEYSSILGFGKSLLAMIDRANKRAEAWLMDNYGITLKEGAQLPKEQRDRINKEYQSYLKQWYHERERI